MTGPSDYDSGCPDLEELAALIDGRLEDGERPRLLEHLDSCERCYEVFTETVRFRQEEGPRGRVLAHPAAARWRRVAAAAAVGALAAGVGLALLAGLDRLTGGAELAPDRVAAALARAGADAGAAWDGRGWSRTRGLPARGPFAHLGVEQRSFRLGVRTVDLALALRAGARPQALDRLSEVQALARSLENAQPLEAWYEQLARRLDEGQPPEGLADDAAEAAEWAADAADPIWYAFGQWAEAGRLAAGAGDLRLLRGRPLRVFPRRLEPLALRAELAAPLAAVAERLAAGPEAGDLAALEEAFRVLVEEGGNR